MSEILFYHLEQRPLEAVLPQLLEKTLERGWRAIVETSSAERAGVLDAVLWTYRDESFLPHAIAGQPSDAEQPVLLTIDAQNGNNAQVRFFVDGRVPPDTDEYQRLVFLFSGHDPEALQNARNAWRALSGKHHAVTYWQQDANGRWGKRA